MDSEEKGTGVRLARNSSIGVAWGAASLVLLAYLLSSDWAFDVLRDGFRLGTVSVIGALIMCASSIGIAVGGFRHESNREFEELLRRHASRYIAMMLSSFAVFAFLLSAVGMLPAIGIYSAGLYYAFGVRSWLPLVLCILTTTVLITSMFLLIGSNIRAY